MQASEIIERISVSDTISVLYHKCADDRHNPDNGKLRSFKSASVLEIYAAKNGVLQVKVETGEGVRSFTSEAIVKSLRINDLEIIKNYSLVE
jgi:hypothetical protein